MKYLTLVSLRCGRFDKRINVEGKSEIQVNEIISNLKYDKNKFILIKQ